MKNLLCAALCGLVVFGCAGDSSVSPTAPSALPAEPEPVSAGTLDVAATDRQFQVLETLFKEGSRQYLLDHQQDEDFNCTNVEEVRVRFSDPGYVDAFDVGMFAKFIGIPAGTKTLRIWWDYEGDPAFQDIDIGDGDVNPTDDSLFDIERIIEHTYRRDEAGVKKARIELIIDDETGNCARNRDIVVAPNTFDILVTRGSMLMCVSGFGPPSLLYGASIVPAIPAGTTYTIRLHVSGTAVPPFSNAFLIVGDPTFTDIVPVMVPATPSAIVSVNVSTTIPHNRVHISAVIFGFPPPTSVTLRILDVEVAGNTVGLDGGLQATCP